MLKKGPKGVVSVGIGHAAGAVGQQTNAPVSIVPVKAPVTHCGGTADFVDAAQPVDINTVRIALSALTPLLKYLRVAGRILIVDDVVGGTVTRTIRDDFLHTIAVAVVNVSNLVVVPANKPILKIVCIG